MYISKKIFLKIMINNFCYIKEYEFAVVAKQTRRYLKIFG